MNVGDGCMPSDLGAGASAELEEERRLLYVAMTRAKDDLHLSYRSAFSHTVSVRKATGMSTHPGRASLLKSCLDCSSARIG